MLWVFFKKKMVTLECKRVYTTGLKLYSLQEAEQDSNPDMPGPGVVFYFPICLPTSQSNAVNNSKPKPSIDELLGHGRLLGVASVSQTDRRRFLRTGDLETGF